MTLDVSVRMANNDDFAGLWRGSAMEKVPYTEDFPEPLLVLPEFYDGAIGQGRATDIVTSFVERENGKWALMIKDDGVGVRNIARLLMWAAPSSVDNYHRNGHGLKKALTKFAPDYASASWSIEWRNPGQSLNTVRGPFVGLRTQLDTDEDNVDTSTLMPSGTKITVEFDPVVLGDYSKPSALIAAVKEIIQTRFSEEVLRRIRFRITVKPLVERMTIVDSEDWHSFEWNVRKGVQDGYIREVIPTETHESRGAPWDVSVYKIAVKGNVSYDLKREFPTYGSKNQRTQRVAIALQDRTIEYAPYHKFVGKDVSHNDDNGMIVIVKFTSPVLSLKPEPSTTKVSMYENNEIYKSFKEDLKEILLRRPAPDSPPPPEPRPPQNKISKLEDVLGVKFKFTDGNVFVQFPGSNLNVWLHVDGFQLNPRA